MDNNCLNIKKELQNLYDIPFSVDVKHEYKDPVYMIIPENEMDELFEISITYRQKIRIIMEIKPQKYAANMLDEMQHASKEKQKVFLRYLQLFSEKKAKVEMLINQTLRNPEDPMIWTNVWNQINIRATQIYISDEETDEKSDLDNIVEWSKLGVGSMLSLLRIVDIEHDNQWGSYAEGRARQALINRYERNPANRELCLAVNGYICKVCDFNFEKNYGEIGHNFIHVHHIKKVSSFGGEYFLDPVKDLIPVCPNCHAMLHRTDPPMYPELLKEIIAKNKIVD